MITIELTEEEYAEAEDSYIGFCIACGAEAYDCEPDARGYKCPECGALTVYGVPELLQMGHIEIT